MTGSLDEQKKRLKNRTCSSRKDTATRPRPSTSAKTNIASNNNPCSLRLDSVKITPIDVKTSLIAYPWINQKYFNLLLLSRHQPSQQLDLRNILFMSHSQETSPRNNKSTSIKKMPSRYDNLIFGPSDDAESIESDGLVSRLFQYFSYVMSAGFSAVSSSSASASSSRNAGSNSDFADVTKTVSLSPRVKAAVDRAVSQDLNKLLSTSDSKSGDFSDSLDYHKQQEVIALQASLLDHHRRRAVTILHDMKAYVSSSMLKVAGWIMFKMLSKMFTSIQFSKKQMETLKKLQKTSRIPILYLPVHRSHMDYILVSFLLYMNGLRVPLGAAGENLKIPLFDTILRGLGAFFIRRKMDQIPGQKDYVYRAVLEEYVVENLKAGESMSVFVEGGRSRSGKELVPRSGLLSFVANAVDEGRLEDVYLVPVGIAYDKIVDGNFVAEQLGRPKTAESFTGAVSAIWSSLRSNFGSVRVDFSQPFSLRDYLKNHQSALNQKNQLSYQPLPSCVLHQSFNLPPTDPSITCPVGLRTVSSDASIDTSPSPNHSQRRAMVQSLAEHIVLNGYQMSSIMSTQMLAFVLLTSYRKGATLRQLIPAMNWLKEELVVNKKKFIGYSGDPIDVIKYAANMLGRELVTTEVIQMAWTSRESLVSVDASGNNNRSKKIVLIKPAVKVPSVLELQFYSNGIATHFALESIVANAIYSLFEWGLETFDDVEDNSNLMTRQNLMAASLDLARILKYDFIISPPCTSAENEVNRIIDNFISRGILRTHKAPKTKYHLDVVDEEEEYGDGQQAITTTPKDDWMSVIVTSDNVDLLRMYRNVVSPLIESYWLGAKHLMSLIGRSQSYDVFLGSLLEAAKEDLKRGLLCFQESIGAESLRHSLDSMIDGKILVRQMSHGVNVVYLDDPFDKEDALKDVVANIERFKK